MIEASSFDYNEFERIKDDLEKKTFELDQRVRELNCMVQISRLSEHMELDFDTFIYKTLEIICNSLLYPEISCAHLTIGKKSYSTKNYSDLAWKIGRGLMDGDEMIGYLTVGYTQSRENKDMGPFTKEEKNLLMVISQYLVQIIRRKRLEMENWKFRALFDQNPMMMSITDKEGTPEYINPRWNDHFEFKVGVKRDLFLEATAYSERNKQQYEIFLEKFRQGQSWTGEIELVNVDGKKFWLRGSIVPIYKEGKLTNTVSMWSDITYQKQIEGKLQGSKENFLQIIKNLDEGLLVTDLNGKTLFANPMMTLLTGYSMDELLGRDIACFMVKDQLTEHKHNFLSILKGIEPDLAKTEVKIRTKSGGVKNFSVTHSHTEWDGVRGNLVIMKDITEKSRSEQLIKIQNSIDSLSSLNENFDETINNIFVKLSEIDWMDCGGLYLFNEDTQSCELYFAVGFSDTFTRNVASYSMDSENCRLIKKNKPKFGARDTFLANSAQDLLDEGISATAILPLVHEGNALGSLNLASKSYTEIPELDKLVLVSLANRIANIIQLSITQNNLSKANISLTQAISDLREKQQIIIQKSRLESIGELAAGLAHEINQPLSVMSMVAENIIDKIDREKATQEYLTRKLKTIHENIGKIKQLIEHFRMFSRDQGEILIDRIYIPEVVSRAMTMIQAQLRHHKITVEISLPDNPGFTLGNPSRLEQVILNLLSNSRDALDEKEQKQLMNPFHKMIRITGEPGDEKYVLRIFDNGIGIAEEELPKVFMPFYSTKSQGHGTGLGLAIVYGIIQEMKGEIEFESVQGESTTVTIRLPWFEEKG